MDDKNPEKPIMCEHCKIIEIPFNEWHICSNLNCGKKLCQNCTQWINEEPYCKGGNCDCPHDKFEIVTTDHTDKRHIIKKEPDGWVCIYEKLLSEGFEATTIKCVRCGRDDFPEIELDFEVGDVA